MLVEQSEVALAPMEALRSVVDASMRRRYGVGLDSMEQCEVPGYWRDKAPQDHNGHPLHSFIGCDGPFTASYTYFDDVRLKGKFASSTRTWAALRAGGNGCLTAGNEVV